VLNTRAQRTRVEERRARWNRRKKKRGGKRNEKEKTSTGNRYVSAPFS